MMAVTVNGSYVMNTYVDLSLVPSPEYYTVEGVAGIIDQRYSGMPVTKYDLGVRLSDFDNMIMNLRLRDLLSDDDQPRIDELRRLLKTAQVQTGAWCWVTVSIDD